jgi:hypothetical protein
VHRRSSEKFSPADGQGIVKKSKQKSCIDGLLSPVVFDDASRKFSAEAGEQIF